MQDAFKVRNFFAKLAAVTTTAESTESLKMLHGSHYTQNSKFHSLQDVLVMGRREEETAPHHFDMQDFGVGLPPLANSY